LPKGQRNTELSVETFKDHSALRLAKTRFAIFTATRVSLLGVKPITADHILPLQLVLPEGSLLEASS
jgi:hypothetical protein